MKRIEHFCVTSFININVCDLGPSTETLSVGLLLNGETVNNNNGVGAQVTSSSRCDVDFFQVNNPGGNSPPIICGQNSGEHSKYYILNIVKKVLSIHVFLKRINTW